MRKFNIKVNGNSYAVEVEEVSGSSASAAPAAAPAPAAPAAVSAPVAASAAPKAAPAPAAPAGGTKIESPMPGDVRKLFFKNGDTVKAGDKIIVLEAMKMENDIVATAGGAITYAVTEGQHIDTGAPIAFVK